METVYIDTSIVSYLVASPSRDVLIAGKQEATRDWWQMRRDQFHCVISSEVVREASAGDQQEARKRLEILRDLTVLTVTPEADAIMLALLATGALPARAQTDAAHLAIATAEKVDYLLTWNCRHLANAQILESLEAEALRLGWKLPKVCTPLELMGDYSYETRSDT